MNKVGETYQRPWGNYKVLAIEDNCQVKLITVNSNQRLSLQKHFKRKEHWFVIQGTFKVQIGEDIHELSSGQSVDIPINTIHRMANEAETPSSLIEIQIGSYLGEDDIVRLEDDYGRK